MAQSKGMSLLETVINTVGGFIVAIAGQYLLFPLLGLGQPSFSAHITLGLGFTVISVIRGYCFRRLFNWLEVRRAK